VVDSNSIGSTLTAGSQQLVSVTALNNPPLITTSVGASPYVVSAPAILIDGSMTLVDPDSAVLVGAKVKITGGFTAGDTLGFNNQGGVSGSYSPGTGVLTLTGSATPLDYQVALRAVTFSTSAGAGVRTITFQADDNATPGTPDGNIATKTVSVIASGSGAAVFFADLGGAPSMSGTGSLSAAVAPVSLFGQSANDLLIAQSLAAASAPRPDAAMASPTERIGASDAAAAGEEQDVAILAALDDGLDSIWL
jgi:hypothetical protein